MKIDLSNIYYVYYLNSEQNRIVLARLTDRKSVDNKGDPWYRGCFGNCLINLKAKFTDKLYLLSNQSMKNICDTGKFHTLLIQQSVDLLEKYADKIITREDLNNLSY